MEKRWDVLAIGCTTVDDLLYVRAYPAAEAKVPVERRERQCGGLSGTALVAAARQGAVCAYGGALGDDEHSAFVRGALLAEGVDLSPTAHDPRAAPIHSTIIVDRTAHTRNIFFVRPAVVGAVAGRPTAEEIAAAKTLFVDHYGGAATVEAVREARRRGVPVVADLERSDRPEFEAILYGCDHLIVSERFAAQLAGAADPACAALALLRPEKQVVVVTCGAAGCWAAAAGEGAARRFPAFPVDAVDTTGCGDVFHGVYAAELARGAALEERIRRASAAAALKALVHGAQAGAPTRAAVDRFLGGE